jgi:hypothetical protein
VARGGGERERFCGLHRPAGTATVDLIHRKSRPQPIPPRVACRSPLGRNPPPLGRNSPLGAWNAPAARGGRVATEQRCRRASAGRRRPAKARSAAGKAARCGSPPGGRAQRKSAQRKRCLIRTGITGACTPKAVANRRSSGARWPPAHARGPRGSALAPWRRGPRGAPGAADPCGDASPRVLETVATVATVP